MQQTATRDFTTDRGFSLPLTPQRLQRRYLATKKAMIIAIVFAGVGTLFGVGWLMIAIRVFGWHLQLGRMVALEPWAWIVAVVLCWPLLNGWIKVARICITRYGLARTIKRMQLGPALTMRRDGLLLTHASAVEFLPWDQVAMIRGAAAEAVPGPELQVVRINGSYWTVPFAALTLLPGTIDSAVWAYSRGQMHLDMSHCEQIWQ